MYKDPAGKYFVRQATKSNCSVMTLSYSYKTVINQQALRRVGSKSYDSSPNSTCLIKLFLLSQSERIISG